MQSSVVPVQNAPPLSYRDFQIRCNPGAVRYAATEPITEAAVIRKKSKWPFAEAAKKHIRNTLTKNWTHVSNGKGISS